MLTIDDIKQVSFRRANFGGYKPEDVDAFIDDVQLSYEKLMSEKEELIAQVKELNQTIKKFYEEDDSIRRVILNAKNIAEKSINDAKLTTENMISAATEKSEKMIEDARKEVSVQNEITDRLKLESAKLRQQLEDIYKRHMDIINEIPNDISALKDEVKDNVLISGGKSEDSKNGKIDVTRVNNVTPNIQMKSKYPELEFGARVRSFDDRSTGAFSGIFRK